jgi:vitamin B12 transporter
LNTLPGSQVSLACWSRAFKAPSFNDLFFPRFGNPKLEPEESESVELGASGDHFGLKWSLNGYYTDIDNLIAPVFDPALCAPPFFICAQNIGEARILGLEAIASTTLLGWDIAANVSWLDPENREEGENKGNLLPRRSQQMFRLDLDRDFGRPLVGVTVYGEGRRFDDVQNRNRLGGYVTVELRAGIELHKHWILEARLSNLLDKDYETVRFFNQDDRNFFLTLRYAPEAI